MSSGHTSTPGGSWIDDALNVPIKFGLRAQGKLDTVSALVAQGRPWDEIGRVIGWDGATAKEFYERESRDG